MLSLRNIEEQLTGVGLTNRIWCKAEICELQHILSDDEHIMGATTGRYHGGFALLVATNNRLLLVDKKPWFLGIEDIRYDMITEVDFGSRLFESQLFIYTVNKTLNFKTMHRDRLRQITNVIQDHVMQIRRETAQLWQAQLSAQQNPDGAEDSDAPKGKTFTQHPIAQAQGASSSTQPATIFPRRRTIVPSLTTNKYSSKRF